MSNKTLQQLIELAKKDSPINDINLSNINRRIASIERAITRKGDPKFSEKMKKVGGDPKLKEIRSQASKKQWLEKRQKILTAREKAVNTDSHREKMNKIYTSSSWREKVIKGGRTQSKKIYTPDGIFDALIDAAKFYNIHPNSMRQRTKIWPDKFYYLDKGSQDAK